MVKIEDSESLKFGSIPKRAVMLELTRIFSKYVPAQQAKNYEELRIAAIDFFESIGIKNPPSLHLSMVLADFMLTHRRPNEDQI